MAQLAIVVPALNEADNVRPLTEQIDRHIRQAGVAVQLIVVDDGSSDATLAHLQELAQTYPWLCILHRDQPRGQSAAMYAGIQHATAPYIATLDADLQNDPADLMRMWQLMRDEDADLVQGDRSHDRQDNVIRRYGSIVGRKARVWLIGDSVRDTGCSARVMKAAYAKAIPLQYRGMHRFIPAYVRLLGGRIVEMPVNHRPRTAGQTKYGLGVLNRGIAGFFDCLAVRWMSRRYRDTSVQRITAEDMQAIQKDADQCVR